MIRGIQRRAYEILEVASPGDLPSKIFDIFIIILIILNVIAVILDTVKSISIRHAIFFRTFEIFSLAVFTVEYVLRVWTCVVNEKFRHPITGRFRFMLTPLAIVDLLAVLPFYLPMVERLDLRVIRVLRLFRIFRLFKLGRYSESFKILGNVIKEKKEEIILTLFMGLLVLIISSSLIYFIENPAQPETFPNIPHAMWWSVVTLTTVGYGDVYPITPLGKILGTIVAFVGIAMFALPAGIIASGFVEEMRRRDNKICPYCGNDISDI